MSKTQTPPPQKVETKALAPIDELKGSLSKMSDQFKLALPPHIPVERFVRVMQTAISQNPDLIAADRTSLFAAAMKAAQEGLLPDGKESAIVTFNVNVGTKQAPKWIKKAQFMPMIAGILKKVRNSGELAMITSNVIYKNDEFKYWVDQDGEHLIHTPLLFGERGEKIGVHAFAKTKDGAVYIEVLRASQVEDIKNVSKSKDSGPWASAFEDEMWRKSALRRLAKRLPMSTDIEMVIRSDDELFDPPETVSEPTAPTPVKTKSSRLHQSMGIEASEQEEQAEREVIDVETVPQTEAPVDESQLPI